MDVVVDRLEKLVKDPSRICNNDGCGAPMYRLRLGNYLVCRLTECENRKEARLLRADIKCPYSSAQVVHDIDRQVFYTCCKYSLLEALEKGGT